MKLQFQEPSLTSICAGCQSQSGSGSGSGLVLVLSLQEPSSGLLSDLQDSHAAFFLRCAALSQRVLGLMAHSLELDPDVFLSTHQLVGSGSFPWRSAAPRSF